MRFGPFYSILLKCWQYVFYVSCKFPMAWSYHHSTFFFFFFFFWKLRIRYKISILGYSAKFFQQKCTREYFIFCYFNAFSLWGYSLPLFYLFFLYFQVDIYESRSFIGGKVGSFVDRRGNHIEMGLHVFFGCYNNLFRLMKKVDITCLVAVIWHSSIRCKLYTLVLYS